MSVAWYKISQEQPSFQTLRTLLWRLAYTYLDGGKTHAVDKTIHDAPRKYNGTVMVWYKSYLLLQKKFVWQYECKQKALPTTAKR